jgi:hypothetical protein
MVALLQAILGMPSNPSVLPLLASISPSPEPLSKGAGPNPAEHVLPLSASPCSCPCPDSSSCSAHRLHCLHVFAHAQEGICLRVAHPDGAGVAPRCHALQALWDRAAVHGAGGMHRVVRGQVRCAGAGGPAVTGSLLQEQPVLYGVCRGDQGQCTTPRAARQEHGSQYMGDELASLGPASLPSHWLPPSSSVLASLKSGAFALPPPSLPIRAPLWPLGREG